MRKASFMMISVLVGCIAPIKDSDIASPSVRLATVEDVQAAAEIVVGEINNTISLKADTTIAAVRDESTRTRSTVQTGLVNVTDQSTSDKWVNRGLMGIVGLVVLLLAIALAYPMGRKRRIKREAADEQ